MQGPARKQGRRFSVLAPVTLGVLDPCWIHASALQEVQEMFRHSPSLRKLNPLNSQNRLQLLG